MKTIARLSGLLLLMGCGFAQAEWVIYGENRDGSVLAYDPARIAYLPDGNIKVWHKVTKSAHAKIAEIESAGRESGAMQTKDGANYVREMISRYRIYSHTMHREVFDCRQQAYKFEESIDYSDDGAVLDRTNMDLIIREGIAKGLFTGNEKRFSEILPGSSMEVLMNKVCK